MCTAGKPQWMVPVSVSTANSPDKAVHRSLLDGPHATFTLDGVKAGAWVKVRPFGSESDFLASCLIEFFLLF